jgi:hypothetical protein
MEDFRTADHDNMTAENATVVGRMDFVREPKIEGTKSIMITTARQVVASIAGGELTSRKEAFGALYEPTHIQFQHKQ